MTIIAAWEKLKGVLMNDQDTENRNNAHHDGMPREAQMKLFLKPGAPQ